AAILSKPGVCAFFLGGVMLALAVRRLGVLRGLTAPQPYALILLSCAPLGLYYLYGTHVERFLQGSGHGRILPKLLEDASFWSNWAGRAAEVLTYTGLPEALAIGVLAVVVCGTVLARPGRPRAILAGLVAGYFVYGFTFTYHVSTHNYYSLPLI